MFYFTDFSKQICISTFNKLKNKQFETFFSRTYFFNDLLALAITLPIGLYNTRKALGLPHPVLQLSLQS
jgi:hypothetical protein